ncbi:uncharacterized protein TNCV_3844351 [Trichonephila clavipes]|nr:uncharacterized protein TNCV_3844351 [Trichonephila clavipes]
MGSLVVRASDSRPEVWFHAEIVEVEIVAPSFVMFFRPLSNFSELNRTLLAPCHNEFRGPRSDYVRQTSVAAVAEWYKYRIVACLVTSSSPVPLKDPPCRAAMLNLSRAEMSSRWCGAVVRSGGASSGVVHVS